MFTLCAVLLIGHSMEPLLHDHTFYNELHDYSKIKKGSVVDWVNPRFGRIAHIVKAGWPGHWVTGPLNPHRDANGFNDCANWPYDPGYITEKNFVGILTN